MGIEGKSKKRASLAELRNRRQAELRRVQTIILTVVLFVVIAGLAIGGYFYVRSSNIDFALQLSNLTKRFNFLKPPPKLNPDENSAADVVVPDNEADPSLELSEEERYGAEETETAEPVVAETIRFAFVGDVYFNPALTNKLKNMPTFNPFAYALTPLNNADLVAANLESPLTNETSRNSIKTKEKLAAKEEFAHKAPPEMASILSKGNVRIVNLANNHILDYNAKGLQDTIAALDEAGISHVGAGNNLEEASQIRIEDVGGLNVAFMGLTEVVPYGYGASAEKPGVWSANNATSVEKYEALFGAKLEEAKSKADIIIVFLHWGNERKTMPNNNQISLGKWLISKGVNLVIGHHPHVVQGIEFVDTGLIAYSLGNFIWNPGSKLTATTGVLVVELKNKEVSKAEFYPGIIKDSLPRIQDLPFSFTNETKGYIDLSKVKPSSKLDAAAIKTELNINDIAAPSTGAKSATSSTTKTKKVKISKTTSKPKTDVVIKSDSASKEKEEEASKKHIPSDFMPIGEEPAKSGNAKSTTASKSKTAADKAKSDKSTADKAKEKEKAKPKPKPEEKPKPKLPLPPGS